ncbi:MAG TPA: permease prefix domain 1-containing protein, partial [Bryobacteraceae bacterium]
MSQPPKSDRDAQFDRELRFHIDKLIEEKMAAGVPPDEARRQAVLEFGGKAQLTEELRDVYQVRIVESAMRNLRSALRFIRKSPSFSATVIVTLALGIGANTAVFSAIDAILLRPMPFPNGDQLMQLAQYNPKAKSSEPHVAPVRVEDWNRMNSTFQGMTGYFTQDVSETSGDIP